MKPLHLLIPVDLNGGPDTACNCLQHFPAGAVGEITLLSVLQFPTVPGNFMQPLDYLSQYYADLKSAQAHEMAAYAARPCFAGYTVHTRCIASPTADVATEVAAAARDTGADLVLLVSRHRQGLEHFFTGSWLLRILRYCEAPMLIVSPDQLPAFHRIAFATDLSPLSARAWPQLERLSAAFRASVVAYRVHTADDFLHQEDFIREKGAFLLAAQPVTLPEVVLYAAEELGEGLLRGAEDLGADVVALATHGRKGISRLFHGSVCEHAIRSTHQPVLLFNLNGAE